MKEKHTFDPVTAKPLIGCVSFETAYIQKDYPYGRHRCKRAVWVETKIGQGMRLVTRTTNPRYRAKEVWNLPHPATYSDVVALWVDAEDYIQTDSLNNIGWVDAAALKEWAERNKGLLEADLYVRQAFTAGLAQREAYEAHRAGGDGASSVTEYGPGGKKVLKAAVLGYKDGSQAQPWVTSDKTVKQG